MKLFCYKKVNTEELTDQETLFLWFLTTMFREAGEEEILTIDKYDFVVMFAGDPRRKVKIEELVEHPLAKMFKFADLGPRYAVSIKEEILAKRYANRKLGCKATHIQEEIPLKIAIYLHAALNLMDDWFMGEEINIFTDIRVSRFGKSNRQRFGMQDRFSVENIIGIDHVHGK